MKSQLKLPKLTYPEHVKSKMTLHLYCQIIGKIRLQLAPRKNHWWYITQYIGTRGFTTGPIPYNGGMDQFEIYLNIQKHQLEISTSQHGFESFALHNKLSVADFYTKLMGLLKNLDISVNIVNQPYDLGINKSFNEITEFHHYDKAYSTDLWKTMVWISHVFKVFSGRFYGKTCPVHLYWHSFDLVVTRFSGNRAPSMPPESSVSNKDAYSHECISFGFWAGDDLVPEPAFYSYTYPSPKDLDKEPIQPASAEWIDSNGSPMAIFKYKHLLHSENPEQDLFNFLESTYKAGAKKAGWDMKTFQVPDLSEL